MFGKKNNQSRQGSIDCLISAKTRIEGDMHFEGGLRIDGQIRGNLSGNDVSLLIVSEMAQLEGEVSVAHAVVNGRIKGSVQVSDRIELHSKAHVIGDVYYHTLEMHPGAVVEGRLVHRGQEVAKPAAVSESNVTPLPASQAKS